MTKRIVDLTFPIHEGMTTFPVHWHPVVELTVLGRHGIEDRETRKLTIGTHTGTHLDAPRHFMKNGKTVDELSLDVLIGPATLLDFTQIDSQAIDETALSQKLNGKRMERLVFRFGWDKKWGHLDYYRDHPYLTESAAQWLVDNGVKLVAMDTPMPDNPVNGRGTANDSPNHKIFLKNDVIIVEYLCNLDQIDVDEFELVVLPLKIQEGDGSPVRCVGIIK